MLLTENAYRMLTNASPASAAPFPEPYAHATAALLAASLADHSVGADVLGSREVEPSPPSNAWRPALAVIEIPQHAHTLGGDLHASRTLLLGKSQTF